MLAALLLSPVGAYCADSEPQLASISFNNASLDGEFDPGESNFSITLKDNTAPATLKSYAINGTADIFVNYLYDETNHPTGLTVTLKFETGSKIYYFGYSNPADYDKNSDNRLKSIYCMYGEISPELNENDNSYKLYIPSDLTELEITPVTSDINAYCAPVTLTLSSEQSPKITLTCIASNGEKRDYRIDIKRVGKTTAEVREEMAQPDYESFVDGAGVFEKNEIIMISAVTAAGAAVIAILFTVTRRITVNTRDKDEKPFYSRVE